MNIQKAIKAVEQAIKLPINIPVTTVIILVTTPMVMIKAPVTAVPARKSPASGKSMKQPIISPPLSLVHRGKSSCSFEELNTKLCGYAQLIFPHRNNLLGCKYYCRTGRKFQRFNLFCYLEFCFSIGHDHEND